jgi:hypothetical protein
MVRRRIGDSTLKQSPVTWETKHFLPLASCMTCLMSTNMNARKWAIRHIEDYQTHVVHVDVTTRTIYTENKGR